MRGTPKNLNSKGDYEYLKANYLESEWRPAFQALLDDRMGWFNVAVLSTDSDEGVIDVTHKVVDEDSDNGTIRYQYEYKENHKAKIFAIGFSVAEIETLLNL